jgi:DNA-binding FadR family transcriptional regulator
MPLQPLGARRLYRQIADQMRQLLASGEYPAGSRLPPERDLAAQLHVSRTSVREALIALELTGVIEVRGGSGVYVTGVAGAASPLFEAKDAGPGPFDLLQARRLVEGEVAALAAETIDADSLAALEAAILEQERPGQDAVERDNADRKFHAIIAESTRNGVIIHTVRQYWEMRRGPMWKKIVEHFHTPDLLAAVVADHRSILEALREHAPGNARRAMHGHLRRIEREFGQGWREGDTPETATGR